jgi:hypothetical protein
MAEFVESRIQDMVPVWEKLDQTGIITAKKLK